MLRFRLRFELELGRADPAPARREPGRLYDVDDRGTPTLLQPARFAVATVTLRRDPVAAAPRARVNLLA